MQIPMYTFKILLNQDIAMGKFDSTIKNTPPHLDGKTKWIKQLIVEDISDNQPLIFVIRSDYPLENAISKDGTTFSLPIAKLKNLSSMGGFIKGLWLTPQA